MTKDGGPADAKRAEEPGGGVIVKREEHGMTIVGPIPLRDYFAALALEGLLASYAHPQSPGIVRDESANFAQHAYQLADAMLAERAKEGR